MDEIVVNSRAIMDAINEHNLDISVISKATDIHHLRITYLLHPNHPSWLLSPEDLQKVSAFLGYPDFAGFPSEKNPFFSKRIQP
jgi:hypothetical protein